MNGISARPRLLGLICGGAAVCIGLGYMIVAGAPARYLVMNLAALLLGATLWLALARSGGPRLAGPAILALAAALAATTMFGISVEGAARWTRVGPLSLQLSLIFVPAMLVLYARRQDAVGTLGLLLSAAVLALQPDRAMAGVQAAALVALLVAARGRLPTIAAAASVLAFAWTLVLPDRLPATPFVDGVYHAAFGLHPLAGLALVAAAAALLLPGLSGMASPLAQRAPLFAFLGCWAAAIVAAALGNYPTPLVGFSGSAILGYLLSAAVLPARIGSERTAAATALPAAGGMEPDSAGTELRVAGLA